MLTLGVTFSGAALAMRGGETSKKQGPPINATSKEEENFIKYVFPRCLYKKQWIWRSNVGWTIGEHKESRTLDKGDGSTKCRTRC